MNYSYWKHSLQRENHEVDLYKSKGGTEKFELAVEQLQVENDNFIIEVWNM